MAGEILFTDANGNPTHTGTLYFDGIALVLPQDLQVPGSIGDIQPSRVSITAKSKFGSVLSVVGAVGQIGPLYVVQDSLGNNLFSIDAFGYMHILKTVAPIDGRLQPNDCILWLDATPGATKLMVKAKDSGGVVRTGSLNLS